MKDDRVYGQYIAERIARIERYTAAGEHAFYEDEKTQDAVLRNLQTLAESTQRLSEEIKQQYAVIDWRSISGFRNVVVHDYLGIDPRQIWRIVADDLPILKQVIHRMRRDLGAS
ncbi:hypothetical protein AWN76_014260 [Rhodothermaceae bacterium RA]|nr:hypothetical protein AWN76_014260 [Rhodothermaceae bacterium RA]